MADVIFKFSEAAIEEALLLIPGDEGLHLKRFKAVLAINGAGDKVIQVTQNGYIHSLQGFNLATDDIVACLSTALMQLNNIIRNQSYLVPGVAVGFDYPAIGTEG
jgi:hypothetical protein